ncbi:MAG: hypothetical protein ACRDRN_17760 [Sciscionella sp.]
MTMCGRGKRVRAGLWVRTLPGERVSATERPEDPSEPVILTPDDLANALLRTFLRNADTQQDAANDDLVAEVLAWKRRRQR